MLQEIPNGLVVTGDQDKMGRIAAARDQNLVDFIAPMTPVDKLRTPC